MGKTTTHITCLCVTENRPAFMPWLLWNFDRQTWANRELVIVDSSATQFVSNRPDVRVVPAPPGTGIAAKRNLALRAARGQIITWFDDDDWQHPEKLALLAEALQDENVIYVGTQHAWFVELTTGRCVRHRGVNYQPVFNSAGFRREAVKSIQFPEKQRKASDTRWMQVLHRRFPRHAKILDREDIFFWLCHDNNLSNPAPKRRFRRQLDELENIIGEAWGDTDIALNELRERLGSKLRHVPVTWKLDPIKSDSPRVTVTIPYFRCRDGIRRAVDSILSQTYPHFRLVVINDGDPQPPWDLLADVDDPRLARLNLEKNQGRYFADAVVVEATEDPYYMVQDADDWSEPERLEILLSRLIEDEAVAAVSAARLYYPNDKNGRTYHYRRLQQPPAPRFGFRSAHHGLFRTDILRMIGGYYGGYKIGYDTLLMNLLQLIGPIAYEEKPLYNRLIRQNSLTTSPNTGMQSRRRKRVHRELSAIYSQAYNCYCQYQNGDLDQARLVHTIAQLCGSGMTQDDRQTLRREGDKLRPLISSGDHSASPQTDDSHLLTLLDNPNLQWDMEWRPAHATARQLVERLIALRPQRILELGSGSTTALFAAYAASSGASVVTLEHMHGYGCKTRRLLEILGLSNQVDVRHSEIRELTINGYQLFWYDYDPDGSFDFVFIDGPPKKFGRAATLFALASVLTMDAEVWLHDGLRQHEQECIHRWQNDFDFRVSLNDCGKGVWVIRDIQPKLN